MFKPFALERYFAAHEFSATYLLCTSDCESMTVDELLAYEPEAGKRLLSTWLGYTESRGNPLLRKEIAGCYKHMGESDILVHAGAEEAILNLFIALAKPACPVIVNTPCYQSLSEIPRALGAKVIPWQMRPVGGHWFLDPDELAGLLSTHSGKGVKTDAPPLVVLNMPHNPTGALLARDEFNRIVSLCRAHGAILLCDEVYRFLELDPLERLPAACDIYENGVSLSVLSKAWGLAGLRIGWIASRRCDILDAVAQVKDYNSICSSAPSEILAGIALRHTDLITGRNRTICIENLRLFTQFFKKWEDLFEWIPPKGGSVAFPRLKSGAKTGKWIATAANSGPDAGILAEKLLEERGVLLLPGKCYSWDPAHFRIGLGRKQVATALLLFDEWLDRQGL
jgi:aspartate/methionine/tyrosine aminotransferase